MNCPGSIRLARELGILHSKAGRAAKEGTAAHEVLARCLENDMTQEPWEFIGTTVVVEEEEFVVSQEMADALSDCYNHIVSNVSLAETYGEVSKYIEVSMKHSAHELLYGTTDCGIVAKNPKTGKVYIWVNDLKYGRGVTVEPTSSQIKYYACLIVDRLMQDKVIASFDDVAAVFLTIMQPRIPHPQGIIRSIELTGEQLETWLNDELLPAVEEALSEDSLLHMGEWCTFCPVKDRCPAMAKATVEVITAKPPEEMTGDELGEMLDKIESIIKMKERFEKVAYERAVRGEKVKGRKLVKKRGNRTWRDVAEAELQKIFGDAAYERSLKSPPQIEKLPDGKKFVAQYAYTPETGLTLAPSSDKRPEARSLMDIAEESDRDMSDLEV
jgi:hypothetical protein